ncbi:hypothetical protein R1flu_016796 [Riccia fluitans]|uniref:Uncharacterized protein n=1 Tax=Riccia fluitans TaxID=41844 RepID=A0ABD1YNP4_9MARC
MWSRGRTPLVRSRTSATGSPRVTEEAEKLEARHQIGSQLVRLEHQRSTSARHVLARTPASLQRSRTELMIACSSPSSVRLLNSWIALFAKNGHLAEVVFRCSQGGINSVAVAARFGLVPDSSRVVPKEFHPATGVNANSIHVLILPLGCNWATYLETLPAVCPLFMSCLNSP